MSRVWRHVGFRRVSALLHNYLLMTFDSEWEKEVFKRRKSMTLITVKDHFLHMWKRTVCDLGARCNSKNKRHKGQNLLSDWQVNEYGGNSQSKDHCDPFKRKQKIIDLRSVNAAFRDLFLLYLPGLDLKPKIIKLNNRWQNITLVT